MSGFEVRILLKVRTLDGRQVSLKDAAWNLTNEQNQGPHSSGFPLRV